MLENSLKIREKYINKLKSKVDSLVESVNLLKQVDKKLLNEGQQTGGAKLNKLMNSYARLQSGGANYNFADIETAALRKKAQILVQRKEIEKLNTNMEALSKNFEPINKALENVRDLINSIQIKLPKLNSSPVPDFSHLPFVYQYNLYHEVPWDNLYSTVDIEAIQDDPEKRMNAFDQAPLANAKKITDDEKKLLEDFHKAKDVNAVPKTEYEANVKAFHDKIASYDPYNTLIESERGVRQGPGGPPAAPPATPPAAEAPAPDLPQIGGGYRSFTLPESLTETPF